MDYDPDRTPTYYLEQFPLIKTEKFSDKDVFTIKNHFISKFKFYETTSFIRINNSCNNSCVHCEVIDYLHGSEIQLSYIKKQIHTAKSKRNNNIIIIGGEPTINFKNLFYTLDEVKKAGFLNITLITNGRMLAYKDFVNDILSRGINQISISLHSVDSIIHDSITSIKGSFVQTIKGIQNLLSNDFQNININVRVTSINQGVLLDIINSLKKMGIFNFYFRMALPVGRLSQNLSLLPDLKLVSKELNEILKTQNDVAIKICGLPFCMLNEKYIKNLTFYPSFNINEYRKLKIKINSCLNCIHYISCLGFYRPEYNLYYNQDIK